MRQAQAGMGRRKVQKWTKSETGLEIFPCVEKSFC